MRQINCRGHVGRYGMALLFILSIAVSMGQESAGKDATQASATPPPVVNSSNTPTDSAKAQEATPPAVATPAPAVTEPAGKGKGAPKKGKNTPSTQSGKGPTFTGVSDTPYVIGPEDVLFLNVLHQADVTGQITVRPDGYVTVRYAGEIKAADLTVPQLTNIVTEKLTTYFNHPEVNIQVVFVRSKKYYLSGEVRKPGSYSLSTPKTILEALIEGGGPADFAKTKRIYILRGSTRLPFNYNDVSKGRHLEQNILLENGDVVVVP